MSVKTYNLKSPRIREFSGDWDFTIISNDLIVGFAELEHPFFFFGWVWEITTFSFLCAEAKCATLKLWTLDKSDSAAAAA